MEDEMPLAMLMINVLTLVGCDVEAAHTGKKALEKAKETKYDLITLDIELPDANGFSLCEKLKERHISRTTPIIFISAMPSENCRQECLKFGAVDYIEKPFKPGNFVSRLFSHLQMLPTTHSPFEEEFP